MRKSVLALLVAAALSTTTTFGTNVFAQEASDADIAQARQLGGQAQQAYEAGKYDESEKLWTAATKLYPKAPTLGLGLARAATKNGHVVLAQENYNKIIREWGPVAAPPQPFKDALEAARAEVGAVSARVASVTIVVEGGAPSPIVTIDGQPVPSAALGLKRPVDGGAHKVHAEAAGYKAADTTFTVAEGGSADAKLKLEKNPDAPIANNGTPGGTTEPPPAAGSGGGGSTKTLAYVAFGVGGAGLLVGAITGIVAIGKHGDLKDKCPDKTCPADQQDAVDSYKTMGTISTIGFIVGGVGVAASAVLFFTAPKESAAVSKYTTIQAKGVTMTPFFGGTSAGLTGKF